MQKKWKLVSIGVYTKMRLSLNNGYLFGMPGIRTGIYSGSILGLHILENCQNKESRFEGGRFFAGA